MPVSCTPPCTTPPRSTIRKSPPSVATHTLPVPSTATSRTGNASPSRAVKEVMVTVPLRSWSRVTPSSVAAQMVSSGPVARARIRLLLSPSRCVRWRVSCSPSMRLRPPPSVPTQSRFCRSTTALKIRSSFTKGCPKAATKDTVPRATDVRGWALNSAWATSRKNASRVVTSPRNDRVVSNGSGVNWPSVKRVRPNAVPNQRVPSTPAGTVLERSPPASRRNIGS